MASPSQNDQTAHFKKTFFEECAELLNATEGYLAELVAGDATPDTLPGIFRAVHSIKGGAGAFSFAELVRFSHTLEAVLDELRNDRIAATRDTVNLLLRATDVLSDMVASARDETELTNPNVETVLAALRDVSNVPRFGGAAAATAVNAEKPAAQHTRFKIGFAPGADLLRRANEPLLIIRALRQLGTLDVQLDGTRVPDLMMIDTEVCHFSWTFTLETEATEQTVREVFEFVEDDCTLSIAVEEDAPKKADAPVAEVAVAAPPANAPAQSAATAASSIRVDTDKVDRMVNLVGELIITHAMLAQQGSTLPADQYPALIQGLETLSQTARELQESVMAIRAQPVKSVFVRMPRLVRELAASLGKEVRLTTSGETTEIDKTVIEQLADPLTHMIRNAVDHGLESTQERIAQGKPEEGTIHLSAKHSSGRIIIEIADDGRGINKDRVLAKARSRGLVDAEATPSDDEINNLIFLPGFSTAEKVTDVSGRGVGMDVVKRNIQSLGGRISIDSKHGAGSRFTLSLPLTLAVLDGMVVSVGGETFIIPLTNIMESLRPTRGDIHPIAGKGEVLCVRGEYVPLVYLHRLFNLDGVVGDPCSSIVIIVETEGGARIGLVVDELLGQQQVVVKSLESNYEAVEGISGATILGNGHVALIVDIARLQGPAFPQTSMRMHAAVTGAAIEATATHDQH